MRLGSSTWTITTALGLGIVSTMTVSAALHGSAPLVPALALGGNRYYACRLTLL